MSIADKLQTIAENVQKVYEAGQKSVEVSNTPDMIYYIKKADNTFQNAVFPENFEFTARFNSVTSFAYMFNLAKNLKSIKLINENASAGISYNNSFTLNTLIPPTLEVIDLTEFNRNVTYMLNAFRYQSKLKSILGELDLTSCTNVLNAFGNCTALEDVTFKPETIKLSIAFAQSSLLSADSIQSIIDGLADLTGMTTQTLTLNSGITLTGEQEEAISSKNWSLVQ